MTTFLGMAALMRGDEGQAAPMFEEGLAVARRIGDRTSTYIALYNLAQAALSQNDDDGAAPHFKEGVTLSEQMGDRANSAASFMPRATRRAKPIASGADSSAASINSIRCS